MLRSQLVAGTVAALSLLAQSSATLHAQARLSEAVQRPNPSNDSTKIVPGHGALATKANLIAFRDMLVTSRDRIDKSLDEGKSEQEVLAAKPLSDLDSKWAANDQQAQNWTRMVYSSFKR